MSAALRSCRLATRALLLAVQARLLGLWKRSRLPGERATSHPSRPQADVADRGGGPPRRAGGAEAGGGGALRQLLAEVERLAARPPAFLLELGAPAAAPLMVDEAGEMWHPTRESGPWDIHVLLSGSNSDPVYGAPLAARLRFDAGWPRVPPEVRVGGTLAFAGVSAGRSPIAEFFGPLAEQGRSEALSLEGILRYLHRFLLDPVSSLGAESQDARVGAQDDKLERRMRQWAKDARGVSSKRVEVVHKYAPLAKHPALFDHLAALEPEWFQPSFWKAATQGNEECWRAVLTEHVAGEVYSFPLLTEHFCAAIVEELFSFHASGLPARRPNSMNNYGVILSDIGLEPFVDKLQALLQPLGRLLFPGPGSAWDGHHCFTVRYRDGEDLGLDMHTDDSDVTFNVCLGLDFSGAGLQFCGSMGHPEHRRHSFTYQHERGRCVMHLGRRRHGADDIRSGERINLILWNQSTTYRRSREYRWPVYLKETGPPEPVCVSHTHDRDFGRFREYPAGKEAFQGRGWCPPPAAEYDGFRSDADARAAP